MEWRLQVGSGLRQDRPVVNLDHEAVDPYPAGIERDADPAGIGFCLGLAVTLRAGVRRLSLTPRRRTLLFAVLVALCVALHAGRTIVRNRDWRSEGPLGALSGHRSAAAIFSYQNYA